MKTSSNLPFRKFQPEIRLPKILSDLLRVKIRYKWEIIPFFKCSKILGEVDKQEILHQMFREFKSSSEQIFSENCRWVRLLGLKLTFVSPQDLVWLPMKYFSRPIQVLSAVNPNR